MAPAPSSPKALRRNSSGSDVSNASEPQSPSAHYTAQVLRRVNEYASNLSTTLENLKEESSKPPSPDPYSGAQSQLILPRVCTPCASPSAATSLTEPSPVRAVLPAAEPAAAAVPPAACGSASQNGAADTTHTPDHARSFSCARRLTLSACNGSDSTEWAPSSRPPSLAYIALQRRISIEGSADDLPKLLPSETVESADFESADFESADFESADFAETEDAPVHAPPPHPPSPLLIAPLLLAACNALPFVSLGAFVAGVGAECGRGALAGGFNPALSGQLRLHGSLVLLVAMAAAPLLLTGSTASRVYMVVAVAVSTLTQPALGGAWSYDESARLQLACEYSAANPAAGAGGVSVVTMAATVREMGLLLSSLAPTILMLLRSPAHTDAPSEHASHAIDDNMPSAAAAALVCWLLVATLARQPFAPPAWHTYAQLFDAGGFGLFTACAAIIGARRARALIRPALPRGLSDLPVAGALAVVATALVGGASIASGLEFLAEAAGAAGSSMWILQTAGLIGFAAVVALHPPLVMDAPGGDCRDYERGVGLGRGDDRSFDGSGHFLAPAIAPALLLLVLPPLTATGLATWPPATLLGQAPEAERTSIGALVGTPPMAALLYASLIFALRRHAPLLTTPWTWMLEYHEADLEDGINRIEDAVAAAAVRLAAVARRAWLLYLAMLGATIAIPHAWQPLGHAAAHALAALAATIHLLGVFALEGQLPTSRPRCPERWLHSLGGAATALATLVLPLIGGASPVGLMWPGSPTADNLLYATEAATLLAMLVAAPRAARHARMGERVVSIVFSPTKSGTPRPPPMER